MELTVQNVFFGYENSEDTLIGVSAAFQPGAFVGIVGPNGSGKTTLLKVISGELRPKSGDVLLDGTKISRIPGKKLARKMAVVPQKTHLSFQFSALDIVMMGRNAHIKRFQSETENDVRMAREAMAQVGVLELQNRLATTLSGGEWQRVIIARALCQDTKVLLLDEPVASLDIKHQIEVLALSRSLTHEKARVSLCVMHDLNLAAHYCDRLILMNKGKILCDGAPDRVLTEKNIRGAYGIESVVSRDENGLRVTPVYERYEARCS